MDTLRVKLFPTHIVVAASLHDPSASGADPAGVTTGPGCAAAPAEYGDTPPVLFLCDRIGTSLWRADIELGDGDDRFAADGPLWTRVSAGNGDDVVSARGRLDGGPGRDSLTARRGGGPRHRLHGGPGDDWLRGAGGPDELDGGPGRDHIELARPKVHGDLSSDIIRASDGETDTIRCRTARRNDHLLLDGLDWPELDERGRCLGVSRSSPARALPSYIDSPDWSDAEFGDYSTYVAVFCPADVPRICTGRVSARVTGHRLGPTPFRVRAGRTREFRLSRNSFSDPDCEDVVPAEVTVRTRRGGRVLPVRETLLIDICPYDSA